MRPSDSAWSEPLGTFALIALAVVLAFGWAWVKAVRDARRERAAAAARLARLRSMVCPMGCDDPWCPNRVVDERRAG